MNPPFLLGQSAQVMNGRLIAGDEGASFAGIFTDTRKIVSGGLFIAVKGESFDGNTFAGDALRQGAGAVVVDDSSVADELRNQNVSAGIILVEDSRKAYLALAGHYRNTLNTPRWIGVTGSAGKSTVKELLAHVLSVGGGMNVHKAPKSFNNEIGLSSTILGADETHQAVVLEIGTNHPGEIAALSAAAAPDQVLITNAAPAHVGAFGSVEAVAREKGSILNSLQNGGKYHLNADDEHYPLWKEMAEGSELSFSIQGNAAAALQVTVLEETNRNEHLGSPIRVQYQDEGAEVFLPLPGNHNAANAAAALSAAVGAGVSLQQAAESLATFSGVERRMTVHMLGGVTVIDDAYNANPKSFEAALGVLKTFSGKRLFVVAGDMLELGDLSEQYHRELGEQLHANGLECVITVGEETKVTGQTANDKGTNWRQADSAEDAGKQLLEMIKPDDVVLLKGSNGMKLINTLEVLKGKLGN